VKKKKGIQKILEKIKLNILILNYFSKESIHRRTNQRRRRMIIV
jgi:hypothetical protein